MPEKYQKCFYCGDLLLGRNSLLKLPDRNVAMLPDLLTLHAVFRRSIKTSYRWVYSPLSISNQKSNPTTYYNPKLSIHNAVSVDSMKIALNQMLFELWKSEFYLISLFNR